MIGGQAQGRGFILLPPQDVGFSDVRAIVEQPCRSVFVQNSQTFYSSWGLLDWAVMNNVVSGLFPSAALTGRRGSQSPFVHIGVETSNTSAKSVEPDPCSSIEGHSNRFNAGVGYKSMESGDVTPPLCVPCVFRLVCCTAVKVATFSK